MQKRSQDGTNRGHSAECPYRLRVFCCVSIDCRGEMHFVRPCTNKNKFFPEGEIDFQPWATPQAVDSLGFQPANGTNRGHSAECPYRLCVYFIVCQLFVGTKCISSAESGDGVLIV